MCACVVIPSISPCLIPTTTVRERTGRDSRYRWGPSGVLRPLADASESANQCDLGIGTEHGVTLIIGKGHQVIKQLCSRVLLLLQWLQSVRGMCSTEL